VNRWSWETYWLADGVFSWIFVPWILGSQMTHDLAAVLGQTPWSTLFWVYFFGIL
jgi:L-rhamnose-H+ transport protein